MVIDVNLLKLLSRLTQGALVGLGPFQIFLGFLRIGVGFCRIGLGFKALCISSRLRSIRLHCQPAAHTRSRD